MAGLLRLALLCQILAACCAAARAGEAVALLQVQLAKESGGTTLEASAAETQIFREAQSRLLTSPPVLNRALLRLEGLDLETLSDEATALSTLQQRLDARFATDSDVLRVSMKGSRPQELVAIVDAVVMSYLHEVAQVDPSGPRSDQRAGDLDRQDVAWMRKQLDELRDQKLDVEIQRLILEGRPNDARRAQHAELAALRRTVDRLDQRIEAQLGSLRQAQQAGSPGLDVALDQVNANDHTAPVRHQANVRLIQPAMYKE
jgi:hypothetical protein